MRLDRTGEPLLLEAAVLDVADGPRQELIAVEERGELPLRVELVRRRLMVGGERERQSLLERVGGVEAERGEIDRRIVEAEQRLLPGGELGEIEVDRTVRDHASRDREAERAFDRSAQQLAADRVTDVVG